MKLYLCAAGGGRENVLILRLYRGGFKSRIRREALYIKNLSEVK